MVKSFLLIGLAAAVLPLGCSSGELEKARGEVKTCEERRASLEQEANSCRKESERQKQSCEAIRTILNEPLPPPVVQAQQEFMASLPEQVRVEAQLQLEKYVATVARNIKDLKDDNLEILQELKQARREISRTSGHVKEVATSTSNLEEGLAIVQQGNEEARLLREQLQVQQAQQQQIAGEIQKLATSILEFDRNRLNCRECKERLRMMGKNREEILKFHSRLVEQMTALQSASEEADL